MVVISKDMKEDILISKIYLKTFKVIPEGFPFTVVCNKVRIQNEMESLLQEFRDVVSGDLSETPMNTKTPMKINLLENVTPKCVTVARRVPLRYTYASK